MSPATHEIAALNAVLDSAGDGVFVLDGGRRFICFNKVCERLTGLRAEDVLGTGCQCAEVMHCRDPHGRSLAGALCPGKAVFDGQAPALSQRMRIRPADGEDRWVETQYTTVRDPAGRPTCIIGIMREASEPDAPAEEAAPSGQDALQLDERLADMERRTILEAIRQAGGQRNLAARIMGISRSRLYRRMEALGIQPGQQPRTETGPPNGHDQSAGLWAGVEDSARRPEHRLLSSEPSNPAP